jgi:hypothetical protein
MFKLAVIFLVIIGPSLAGIAVVGLLTMDIGTSSARAIVTAAGLGALLALPVSYVVAGMVSRRERQAVAAT